MASRLIKLGVPLAAGLGGYLAVERVHNDTRRFYEDDADVLPAPGTVVPAAGTELKSMLGTSTSVDGTSVRSARFLERVFKLVRETVQDAYLSLRTTGDEAFLKFNNTERAVTLRMSQLHNRQEDLLPNAAYVAVAALAGTIAGRKHGFLARATLPVVFGTAAFRYFLPQTFANTTSFLWDVEQQKMPEVALKQQELVTLTENFVRDMGKTTEELRQFLLEQAEGLRRKVASITGLNVEEDVSKK